jgi:metal-responsive CopG/Arc/MetJ family transcriptional regulator
MKIAISVPDSVFEEAEDMARRLKVSRSELYARAVKAFIAAHSGSQIREALDRVYATEDSRVDPALERAQLEALPDEGW